MRKTKLLAIAPFEGMAEMLNATAKDRKDIDMTIRIGNLNEGLQIARTMTLYENYDAILSRGGTAELIQNELPIPVIEVAPSVYDILRCIKMSENSGGKIAITGFNRITEKAKVLCDLLQLNITIVTFREESEVLPEMLELKERQFSFVICDQISFVIARKIGLNAVSIPSGSESIKSAINEAVRSVQSVNHLNKQIRLFQSALLQSEGAALIYDSKGELYFSSLLGSPFGEEIDREIHSSLSALLGSNVSILHNIGEKSVKITTRTLNDEEETFTLFHILEKNVLFVEEKNPISVYNEVMENENPEFSQINNAYFYGSSHILLEKYAAVTLPVLITGEKGTGKEKAAHLLYRLGPYRNRPYYVINCSLLNDRKLNALLNNETSPLTEINVTIHIKEINHLSSEQFEKLCCYIQDSQLLTRNRILFSCISPSENAETFQSRLNNRLSCLLLTIEPLHERRNDIPSIAAIYINQLNALLGKQIIGFQPDALELVKNYCWPNNLDQFRRVIRELAVMTDSSYISADSVSTVLRQENRQYPQVVLKPEAPALNLNQTLEQITRDIIVRTLAEENGNKERTARRLGISRSTIWRSLKNQ